jgi:uncharacterized phage-associated protein
MSSSAPASRTNGVIDIPTLVRALASRQPRLSGLRLTKLAYLAEVRFAAGHGQRLTNAAWWSWKYGPFSRDVISAARALSPDLLTSSNEEVLGKVATYYRAGPECQPELPEDVTDLLDDLIDVYGHEDTTLVVSAAYRSTPFQRTPPGTKINLNAWAVAMGEATRDANLATHLQRALGSDRKSFNDAREVVEFLNATRKSSGADA